MDIVKQIEFRNAVVNCRKQEDYILDIYREVVAAFEKTETDPKRGRGIEKALTNAKKAGIITELEEKRMKEDWHAIPDSKELGDLQENMEERIFNIPFNCALKAVVKLSLT